MTLALQGLAQLFTERLLNTAAEGVVLVGLVWLLLRLAGRQNSGTRFAIWFSTLLAIIALPFVSVSSSLAPYFTILASTSPRGRIVLSPSVALWVFIAWCVGAGALLLRLSVGLWRVRQFQRNCSDLNHAALDPAVGHVVRDFESRERVELCVSSEATVPAAIGFFRPAIVFPAGLLPQLSAAEIEIVLLHEFAHLRRCDDWTNLAQKIVKALFFFHPAVWWIETRLTLEREMACDDMVLAQTASPRAYASSLISFAEKLHGARGLALAQALVSRMHQMSLRVAQILDAKRPRPAGMWRPVLGLSAIVLALAVGAAPYMPRFVAFQAEPTRSQTRNLQVAQQEPAVTGQPAAMIRSVVEPSAQLRFASQARAIPAVFHPRTAVVPIKLKPPSRRPLLTRASAPQEELPTPEAIFIVRTTILGTTHDDASGSGIWTLCIWRVRANNPADGQVESAILVSLI